MVVKRGCFMAEELRKSRDIGFDNIRFILIFCVVFAHLLEFCKVPGGDYIYRLIYLFHMPCFVFLNGYFAKDTPSTTRLCRQVMQYIIFQTAYLWFAKYFLNEEVTFQYTTPYWLLWFCLTSILYPVLLHAYHLDSAKKRIGAVAIAFLISLLTGFDDSVGYHLSLSRLIVFQPFFLLGYCWHKEEKSIQAFLRRTPGRTILLSALILFGLCASMVYCLDPNLTGHILYRSFSYSAGPHTIIHRLTVTLLALAWTLFFILIFKRWVPRKIPFVSCIGANTLPVYFLHGFIMRFLSYYHPPFLDHYLSLFLITAFCLLALGNPFFSRIINPRLKKRHLHESVSLQADPK